MNDFIIAGIATSVIVLYIIALLYAAFQMDDHDKFNGPIIIYGHIIFTLICLLFVLGGVPYIITLWLISFGVILGYGLYLDFNDRGN